MAAWLLAFGAPLASAEGGTQVRATVAKPAAALGSVPAPARHAFPLLVQNRANYEALKHAAIRRAQRSGALPGLVPSSPAPRASVLGGTLNAPGLNADDNSAFNDGTPPDTTGAIGPNAYIEFVNTVIAEYDRNTLARIGVPVQGDHFMGVDGDVTFDIQIQWDQEGGRWFYLADDCGTDVNCATANSLVFGWSKTADPAGLDPSQWCHFQVQSGTGPGPGNPPLFDDYPKLGHDDNHLIFGTNMFGGKTGQTFEGARIWVVPKPAPGDAICPTTTPTATTFGTPGTSSSPLTLPNGNLASTPVPANTADSLGSGYVVAADDPTADNAPKDKLMAWHVTNTSPPTLAEDGLMTVATYNVPAPAAQAGSPLNTLDTLDARLTQAVAVTDPSVGQEAVWTQHTIDGPGGRSVDRWYELLPGSLTVRQQGTISNPTDFVFNGAISPTIDGRAAAIDYNVSGTDRNPEIRAQSRESSVPLGQMVGEITLDTSAAADQDFSCPTFDPTAPSCRWGDYAGASPDPLDSNAVWGSNQTLNPPHPLGISTLPDDPHWRTRNFALATNAPPAASFTVSPNPATAGAPVTFNAAASSDAEGSIADYAWDLDGDGTFETDTGTNPVVTRSYPSPGALTVSLRVTDGDGLTSSTGTVLTVNPAAGPPRDTTPPILRLSFKKGQKLGTVLRRGVTGKARCNERCTVRFTLQIARRTARKLHIAARFVTTGRLTKRLAANRTTTIHVKLARRARRRLSRVRRINVRLVAQATDLAGNRGRALHRTITLKR